MLDVLAELQAELKKVRVLSRSKDGMSVVVGTERKWSEGVETGRLRKSGGFPFTADWGPADDIWKKQWGTNPIPKRALIDWFLHKKP